MLSDKKRSKLLRKERKEANLGLNLVPLSDIIFNLLLFFLLASPLFFAPTIEVILPKAKAATTKKKEDIKHFILTITKSGYYFLGNRRIPPEELATSIRAQTGGNKKVIIAIRGDENTPYSKIVFAIDAAKESGIVHINLVTDLYKGAKK
ncbi:ExbD/TolR family protein [Elusimicrobiota bacterium]